MVVGAGDYRTLVRAALDGFCLLDGAGRFLDANDAYCELLGYTLPELQNMSMADVEANETRQDVLRHLQALKQAGSERFETRHRARDGLMIDFEVSANYAADSGIIFVFLRDITARKTSDAILRQRTFELSERVKELRCLLDLNILIERDDLSVPEILQHAVELLPLAWQYPSITAAQLTMSGTQYATPNFKLSPLQMVSDLRVDSHVCGQIRVVYLEAPPDAEDDPFLPEEYALLNSVAQRLGGFIQRRRAEESLQLREMSLNSLLDLSQQASTMQERDIIQLALEEVERLTNSKIGYLHFVNADQNSIQLYTWSQNTLTQCSAARVAHYPLNLAGVWADCARWKRPVVHNDYQNHPNKRGYPPGHSHLIRHASVPVVEDGVVHLILGVGNKPQEYDEADVRQLVLTADHLWRIVRRKRAENEARRESERVAVLARVAAQLNSQLKLSDVLQTICAEAARALGFPSASLCLYEYSIRTLCYSSNSPDHLSLDSQEVEAEVLSLIEMGVWDDDIFVLPRQTERKHVGALVAVRLTRGDLVLGILAVYRLGEPGVWEVNEMALLRGMGNLAVQAITKARLFAEVLQNQDQLKTLSRRLVEVQEAERRHIARELHDEVGQVLTAVKINLQVLRRQPALQAHSHQLDENIESVQRALEQVRSLSLDLRPSILDDLGLSAALEWYAPRLMKVADVELELTLPSNSPRWSPTIEITCFRVAQEALTNILRHANARKVWIEVRYSPEHVQMSVRDDGRGFEPDSARRRAMRSGSSVGLLSMAERVALAGGHLDIESLPGQGASITVIFYTPILRDDRGTFS